MSFSKTIKTIGLASLIGLNGCSSKQVSVGPKVRSLAELVMAKGDKFGTPSHRLYVCDREIHNQELEIVYEDVSPTGPSSNDTITINLTSSIDPQTVYRNLVNSKSNTAKTTQLDTIKDCGLNGLYEKEGDYMMHDGTKIPIIEEVRTAYSECVDTCLSALRK